MNAHTRAEALRLVDEIEDEASTRYECARQVDLQLEAVLLGCNKLRALLSASDNGWRTMESAPRDGTTIIVYRPIHDGDYIPMVGVDHIRMKPPYKGVWGRSRTDTPPAAWMPLPPPPNGETK